MAKRKMNTRFTEVIELVRGVVIAEMVGMGPDDHFTSGPILKKLKRIAPYYNKTEIGNAFGNLVVNEKIPCYQCGCLPDGELLYRMRPDFYDWVRAEFTEVE